MASIRLKEYAEYLMQLSEKYPNAHVGYDACDDGYGFQEIKEYPVVGVYYGNGQFYPETMFKMLVNEGTEEQPVINAICLD